MRSLIVICTALLLGCQSATPAQPRIQDARMSAAPPGATVVAGYMTIDNPGATDWTLASVDSPRFERIEVHTMSMEGGMMRMRPATDLAVPAAGQLELAPGGAHLMMFGPKGDAATPAPATVTLKSAGDTLSIDVQIAPGAMPHH